MQARRLHHTRAKLGHYPALRSVAKSSKSASKLSVSATGAAPAPSTLLVASPIELKPGVVSKTVSRAVVAPARRFAGLDPPPLVEEVAEVGVTLLVETLAISKLGELPDSTTVVVTMCEPPPAYVCDPFTV